MRMKWPCSNIASISSSPLQDPAINMSLGQPYLMASLDLVSESSQEFYDEASTPLIEKLTTCQSNA